MFRLGSALVSFETLGVQFADSRPGAVKFNHLCWLSVPDASSG